MMYSVKGLLLWCTRDDVADDTAFSANGNSPLHWSKTQSDPRGHEVMPFLCVPLLDSGPVYMYTFYMTCRLEFDISIITEPVYYYRLVYSISIELVR